MAAAALAAGSAWHKVAAVSGAQRRGGGARRGAWRCGARPGAAVRGAQRPAGARGRGERPAHAPLTLRQASRASLWRRTARTPSSRRTPTSWKFGSAPTLSTFTTRSCCSPRLSRGAPRVSGAVWGGVGRRPGALKPSLPLLACHPPPPSPSTPKPPPKQAPQPRRRARQRGHPAVLGLLLRVRAARGPQPRQGRALRRVRAHGRVARVRAVNQRRKPAFGASG
jgi:hypothetical protein